MNQRFIGFLAGRGVISEAVAERMAHSRSCVREPIGMIAVGHGLLRPDQIDLILDRQRNSSLRFGDLAIELGCLTQEQVELLLAIQEFRASAAAAEAMALAGTLPWDDVVRYLGAFLTHDDETAALLAER